MQLEQMLSFSIVGFTAVLTEWQQQNYCSITTKEMVRSLYVSRQKQAVIAFRFGELMILFTINFYTVSKTVSESNLISYTLSFFDLV